MSNGYVPELGYYTYMPQNASSTVEVIVKGDILALEGRLDIEVEALGMGYAIATLKREQIPALYKYKEVEYIELPKTLTLTQNMSTGHIPAARFAGIHGLTGADVILGVIDSGIDYTHPDFRNASGESRILFLWDQTQNGNPPHGFKQGAEYDNLSINAALQSAQPYSAGQPYSAVPSADYIGHGTAVAGIAGAVAPEALLVIVKLGYRGYEYFARTTEIMRALKYITDKAEMLGKPVAVNLSFGMNNGSHDGNSLFETYIDAVAQKWKCVIVVASGNEGAAGHHFYGRIDSNQSIDVDFTVSEHISSLYLTLWKNFVDRLSFELILPGGEFIGISENMQPYTQRRMGELYVMMRYGQPTHYSEAQEVFINIQQQKGIPRGLWRLRAVSAQVVDGGFDVWLPTVEEAGIGTAFTRPSPSVTLTIPSTARNVITVGGYNDAIDAPAPFSGRGFTRGGVYVKPDITAPAVGIVSSRAGGGYDAFTGTSFAAPYVTGAACLMMHWGIVLGNDPFLYGQRIKAIMKKNAARMFNVEYPNPITGYGLIDIKRIMDNLVSG